MQISIPRAPASSLGVAFVTILASLAAAIGTFMAYRTMSTLLQLVLMLGWPTTPATLQSVELQTSRGATARSQIVAARYGYTFNGQSYTGSRVSLYPPDNLGTFHKDAYRELHDYLTRQAPYPLHVNPRAPGESILMPVLRMEAIGFYLVLTIVFGGGGWTLLVTTLRSVQRRRAEAALAEQYPGEPWRQRIEWADSRIRSTQGADAVAALCLAVLWNAATFPIPGIIVRELRSGHRFALVFAVVPLFGVGLLSWAAVALTRAQRFRNTFLQLDTVPVRQGEALRGRIQAPKALESVDAVSVHLTCERRSIVGGRNASTTRAEQLWLGESTAPVVRGQTADGGVTLTLAIDTPAGLPSSSRGTSSDVLWLVSARAPLKGADFEAEFEVPVFARAAAHAAAAKTSSNARAKASARPAQAEKAPPREAWAMRLILIGMVLLGVDYAVNNTNRGGASFLERQFAARVMATGDVTVLGQADDRIQAAFARARAAQPGDAGLNVVSDDQQSRRYQAWVTAPSRDEALAQLGTLLARFEKEDGGEPGRDVQTFSNPYVPPVSSPELAAVTGRITWGLLLFGCVALAGGGWLFTRSPAAAQARMSAMLVENDDEPGDETEVT